MGRKNKNTTFDVRQLVIFHHANGKSYNEIRKLVNLSKSTVGDIVRRYKNEDRIESKLQTGRPKKLSAREEKQIVRKVVKNPRISAPKLKTEVLKETGKEVHEQTIRRILKNSGYNGRVARKKPFISEANKRKRLKFAKEFKYKDDTWWNDVIFADESKYNIFGSDGQTMVWRKPNTELQPQNLRGTVKHGGGSVMVWGCISSKGVGKLVFIDGIVDKYKYLDILNNNLLQSAHQMGIKNSFKFYQDNDPKHQSRLVQEFLLYKCPKILHPPPQSPDLNPIENLWDELDRKIRMTPITNKAQLKERLQEEWNLISTDYLKKIILNMPKRLQHVIKQKGYPTKY